MILDKQQKEDLKSLIWHRGFKTLEAIVKDFEYNTLSKLKTINLADQEALKNLNAQQNYLLWVEAILNIIKTQSDTIANKKFDK